MNRAENPGGSQRHDFLESAVTQVKDHAHRILDEFFKIVLQGNQTKKRAASLKGDQQVDIAPPSASPRAAEPKMQMLDTPR